MKSRLLILVGCVLTLSSAQAQFYGYKDMPVPGQSRISTDEAGANVRIDQKLGTVIPGDVILSDEEGKQVRFEELFNGKPVILNFVFYSCTGACTDLLMGLSGALHGFRKDFVGTDYDVITVSIDPSEKAAHARSAEMRTLDMYGNMKPETKEGWHFLTGSEAEVRRLADSVGFIYELNKKAGAKPKTDNDESNNDTALVSSASSEYNITHPAGIIVVSPQRQVTQYFINTEYTQRILLDAIDNARINKVGYRDDKPFYMACINIDPLTGQKTLNILNTLKVLGLAIMLGLSTFIVMSLIKEKSKKGLESNS